MWRAKGVTEEFSAYGQRVATALAALDQGLYGLWRDAIFDEHGWNVALYEEIHEVSNVL
jgi:hypothetical protein